MQHELPGSIESTPPCIGRDSLNPINADEAPSRHIARLVRRALRLAVVQKALLAKWS